MLNWYYIGSKIQNSTYLHLTKFKTNFIMILLSYLRSSSSFLKYNNSKSQDNKITDLFKLNKYI